MSTYGFTSRINLQPSAFPFRRSDAIRTAMLSRYDLKPTAAQTDAIQAETSERQVPHIIYAENVMPTAAGFVSVGYDQVVAGLSGISFLQKFEARDDTGILWYIAKTSDGLYFLDSNTLTSWKKLTLHSVLAGFVNWQNITISSAQIQGATYFYANNIGAFTINYTTESTEEVIFNGLLADKIKGIVGTVGYLIAFDDATMYWGAAEDFLDFVPDPDTGADSQIPSDLKGQIVTVQPVPQGMIIYTTKNAVGAGYTNNLRNPWIFREIAGSAGINNAEQVSSDENFADHVVWSTAGLSQISRLEHRLIHVEASDFLSGRVLDLPAASDTALPTIKKLAQEPQIKVQLVGSRYLVISYGEFTLTQALIYDQSLRRWGKLIVPHVDVFELVSPYQQGFVPYTALKQTSANDLTTISSFDLRQFPQNQGTAQHSLVFMQADGKLVLLNMDELSANRSGVLHMGRFAITRERTTIFHGATVNSVESTDSFKLFASVSYNGKKLEPPVEMFLASDVSDTLREYLLLVEAVNVTLIAKGSFKLTDIEITVDGSSAR